MDGCSIIPNIQVRMIPMLILLKTRNLKYESIYLELMYIYVHLFKRIKP